MPEKNKANIWKRAPVIILLALLLCTVLTSCFQNADGTTTNIFDLLIVKPFAFILKTIYQLVHSYGLAIIIFTILTKILLLPLTIKSKKGMMEQQRIAPKLKELENKYKNDKQKYQEEMTKLYQKEGISPMGGCLPTLISLPIMLGLYWPISQPLTHLMNLTKDQIAEVTARLGLTTTATHMSEMTVAQAIYENFDKVKDISDKIIPMNFDFLGVNLGAIPSFTQFNVLFLLPIISGATAFALTKLTNWLQYKSTGVMPQQANGMMTFIGPVMSIWIGFSLPVGLTLYWITGNLISMLQEILLTKYFDKLKLKEEEKIKFGESAKQNNKTSKGAHKK
ncbi:MAG: YidC/Oxa1 family membrane protein insertase [Clostridiales bacterium]|jgi:YidC/Oxa1 family membrane protein insertase|nr:YidC/Oxa1 family membrane protein insertase [Clostridiales bacterium]